MLLQEDQQAAPMPLPQRRRWRRPVIGALALVLVAAVGAGGFFGGQSTRKSDSQVTALTTKAVQAEKARQQELRRKALDERKARDKATLRRVVTKMKRSAARKAEQSYASGQTVGYSSGHSVGKDEGETEGYVEGSADGYEDGLTTGSDSLDCSDDVDVYWLPSC